MCAFVATALLPDEAATTALATRIAGGLRAGDVILLSGEIGSGKSHFARAAILARLAHPEDIPSPTYTLVQTYQDADGLEIWHCDLYRLGHADDLLELGLEEALSGAICIVEWPQRFEELWPGRALWLSFETTGKPGQRTLTARTESARWAPLMKTIADAA